MNLDVLSMGVIGAFGRGRERLSEAMSQPAPQPTIMDLPRMNAKVPVRRVEDPTLQDPILNPARRAGRFIKMAMLAAADCLRGAALEDAARQKVGLVLVTGMGSHETNFGFVDGLLDFGMNQGSPTHFSHSVHNAATSYIAAMSGSHGPTLTVTHFVSPLHQGLDAAWLLLNGGTCDHVLLTAVDELGGLMLAIYSARGMVAGDGVLRCGALDAPIGIVPGEGAASFLLSRPGASARRIGALAKDEPGRQAPGLVILDHDGLWSDGPVPAGGFEGTPTVCRNDVWGSFPCGTGLALAAGLCMLSAPQAPERIACLTHRPGVPPLLLTA